jgi:NAD(P)-dependent dehydrogenase (short-subunit alcohol dehydrogenase family)
VNEFNQPPSIKEISIMSNQNKVSFKAKVALVTGAASGIGRATAVAFAREGANVVLADVSEEGAQKTAEIIEKNGGRYTFVKCDVSSPSEVKNLMNKTIETFGRFDYAFNNAGIEGQQANTSDCTEENWDRVIDTNLKGVWLCMKYELPQMVKQGGGAIVNCASIAGLTGFEGIPAYVASKHGIVGLTQAAALEYSKSNIRINAVCPGVIDTPMVDRLVHGKSEMQKELVKNEPIGRMGKPEEIAEAVLWLCSDAASFVVGHPLAVDGGWMSR